MFTHTSGTTRSQESQQWHERQPGNDPAVQRLLPTPDGSFSGLCWGFRRTPTGEDTDCSPKTESLHQNTASSRRGGSHNFTWWGRSSNPPRGGWGPDPAERTESGDSPVLQSSEGPAAPPAEFSARPKPRCGRSCPRYWGNTGRTVSDKPFPIVFWKVIKESQSRKSF